VVHVQAQFILQHTPIKMDYATGKFKRRILKPH